MLFSRGGVFLASAAGLVTQKAYTALKNIGVIKYHVGPPSHRREVAAAVPIPQDPISDDAANPLRQSATEIYKVFKAFFDVNFPLYELTNCYAAFDLDSSLTWSQRETFVKALCAHEKLDADLCWSRACVCDALSNCC